MIDETLLLEIVDNQHWSFPLQEPLILDSKLAGDNVQLYLRLTQFINQNGKCLCGQDLDNTSELHHALISRKDAINLEEPTLIHSSYNCLLLHHKCHQKIRRALCLVYLLNIFTFKEVQNWYQSVKSKMKSGGFRDVEGLLTDELLPEW